MTTAAIRPASVADSAGAYYVCLKTGDHVGDVERDSFTGPALAQALRWWEPQS